MAKTELIDEDDLFPEQLRIPEATPSKEATIRRVYPAIADHVRRTDKELATIKERHSQELSKLIQALATPV